ncbi:MAG: MFS transporter [Sporichthyaceae bacterium]
MRRHIPVLVAVCLAVFTIQLATMIVNIALPSLTSELDANTRDLLWIVDGFNFAFAALVLAMGSLSDRLGRRGTLLIGLLCYFVANAGGAFAPNPDLLVAWRVMAGIGAAIVFPTTLSILVNEITDRKQRAAAIGMWGAATGVAVAVGPILGGALLERYWWGSTLLLCAALAAVSLVVAWKWAPNSADPTTPPLDYPGLVLSTLGFGALVYAIIEGPELGWSSNRSLGQFALAALILAVFVVHERRVEHPMLDVRLFANMRFTAASGAVTFAFFALFGFIFLITQYFQFVRGYGALEAGMRTIPVATAIAIASLLGPRLALAIGTKTVVTVGLVSFAVAFAWISTASAVTPYEEIVGQMVLLGAGLGLTSAPATEAIMGVVPAAKAGVGSAVNDATRELGGTLGVAVIGSVATSVYVSRLRDGEFPAEISHIAEESYGAASLVARVTGNDVLAQVATNGFLDGLSVACLVAMGVCLFGALLVLFFLPAHPEAGSDDSDAAAPSAPEVLPQAVGVPLAEAPAAALNGRAKGERLPTG